MKAHVYSDRVVTPAGVGPAWLCITDGVLVVADDKVVHDPPPGRILRRGVVGSGGTPPERSEP